MRYGLLNFPAGSAAYHRPAIILKSNYLYVGWGCAPALCPNVDIASNIILRSPSTIAVNTWYHVALVLDNNAVGKWRLVINGGVGQTFSTTPACVASTPGAFTTTNPSSCATTKAGLWAGGFGTELYIFGDSGAAQTPAPGYFDCSFVGFIDEVRMWSTARSNSQILSMYNQVLVGNEAGLVNYFRMDGSFNPTTGTGVPGVFRSITLPQADIAPSLCALSAAAYDGCASNPCTPAPCADGPNFLFYCGCSRPSDTSSVTFSSCNSTLPTGPGSPGTSPASCSPSCNPLHTGSVSALTCTAVANSTGSLTGGVASCSPLPPPSVSSVSPTGAIGGSVVNIQGFNFGTVSSLLSIFIGGRICIIQPASFTSSSLSCTLSVNASVGFSWINMSRIVSPDWPPINGSSADSSVSFEVITHPTITAVSPSTGLGGQTIDITGTGFGTNAANIQVSVGGGECESITSLSSTFLTCTLLPRASGTVPVIVMRFGIASLPPHPTFTYSVSTSVSLLQVQPQGCIDQSTLTILGSAFGTNESAIVTTLTKGAERYSCAIVTSSLRNDGNLFICRVIAPSAQPGVYVVSIRIADLVATNNLTVSIINRPVVSSIFPEGGRGGSLLTIAGSNFPVDLINNNYNNLLVTLGTSTCSITMANTSTITCFVPALLIGLYPVRVFVYGSEIGNLAPFVNFQCVDPPSFTSISPSAGINNTFITLYGSFFGSNLAPLTIAISSSSARETVICPPQANSLTSSSLVCLFTLPSATNITEGSILAVNLMLFQLPAIGPSILFEYMRRPVILSFLPTGGVVQSIITISGTDFGNSESSLSIEITSETCPSSVCGGCLILAGSLNAAGSQLSCVLSNDLTVTGTYNLFVTRQGVPGISPSSTFTLITPPVVDSIIPVAGLTSTVNSITILGYNFGDDIRDLDANLGNLFPCVINSTAVLSYPPLPSLFYVVCRVTNEGGSTGLFSVSLRRFGVRSVSQSSIGSVPFNFIQAPSLTDITPRGGVPGTLITLRGFNFGLSESLVSIYINIPPFVVPWPSDSTVSCPIVPGSLNVQGTSIQCVLPMNQTGLSNLAIQNRFNITLARYDNIFAQDTLQVEYFLPPYIHQIHPSGYLTQGGQLITLIGKNFGSEANELSVQVGESVCFIDRDNFTSTSFACVLPPGPAGVTNVSVLLLSNIYSNIVAFTYFEIPTVVQLIPMGGGYSASMTSLRITVVGYNFGSDENSLSFTIGDDIPCLTIAGTLSVSPPSSSSPSSFECVISNTSLAESSASGATDSYILLYGLEFLMPFSSRFVVVNPVPTLSECIPNAGVLGSQVVISGSGFGLEESAIAITVTISSPVTSSSSCILVPNSLNVAGTSLTCRMPVSFEFDGAGVAIVSISLYGIAGSNSQIFTFLNLTSDVLPVVFNIEPQGGAAFGTLLTVNGANFAASSIVTVGGDPCTIITFSNTRIVCNTSITNGGFGDYLPVIVRMSAISSQPPHPLFIRDVLLPPSILSLSVLGGRAGDVLRISGYGFATRMEDIIVTIGSSPCNLVNGSLTYEPSTHLQALECIVPFNPLGLQSVLIESLSETTLPPFPSFFYVSYQENSAVITSIQPTICSIKDLVTIFGTGFRRDAFDTNQMAVVVEPESALISCEIEFLSSGSDWLTCRFKEIDANAEDSKQKRRDGGKLLGRTLSLSFSVSVFGVKGEDASSQVLLYSDVDYVPSDSIAVVFFAVIVTLIGISLLFTIGTYAIYRNLPIFRSHTPELCLVMQFGLFLPLNMIFAWVGYPTTSSCLARAIIPAFAFTVTYATLFVVVWRVNVIFNNKSLRRVVLGTSDLSKRIFGLLFIDVLYAIVVFAYLPPKPDILLSRANVVYATCSQPPSVILIFFAWKLILTGYGAYLAFCNRNVNSNYNESKAMAFAIFNFIAIVALTAPVAYALGDNPLWYFIIISAAIVAIAVSFTFSVFGRRMLAFYSDFEALKKQRFANSQASSVHLAVNESLSTQGEMDDLSSAGPKLTIRNKTHAISASDNDYFTN